MSRRESKAMQAMRTPWVAYPFAAAMFVVWGWRQYNHLTGKHVASTGDAWGDWAVLGLGIIALPPLRALVASGLTWGLDFYRRFRAAKEPEPEGDKPGGDSASNKP